jgi:hypothetical protein
MVFNSISEDVVEHEEWDTLFLTDREVDVDQTVIESVSAVWA